MIPKVKTWKVTAVETGRVIHIDTINKKFARWIARTEFGMWGKTLKVSLVPETPAPKKSLVSLPAEVKNEILQHLLSGGCGASNQKN